MRTTPRLPCAVHGSFLRAESNEAIAIHKLQCIKRLGGVETYACSKEAIFTHFLLCPFLPLGFMVHLIPRGSHLIPLFGLVLFIFRF